jgi:hypothetical protein
VAPSSVLVPFQEDVLAPVDGVVSNGNGIVRRMVRFASKLAVPDGKVAWLPAAVWRGLRISRDYPIGMCFSISPRPTSHLVARRVARSLKIPWVADFAHPWSDAPWLSRRPRLIKRLDQRLEGSVIRSAHHITVANPDIARGICGRFGAAGARKLSVIPTGFNDELFKTESAAVPSKFRVLYPGNYFCEEGRHGEYFLKAIDKWIGMEPRLRDQVEFVFIGKRDDALLRQRATMAHPDVVRVEPLISHRACIQLIQSSHMCVVNTVGNRIPAKTYECMRAGKRILALTDPGSDLDALVGHHSGGISIPAQDVSAIRDALESTWQSSRLEKPERREVGRSLQMYSSKHSAEKLSRIFEDLLLSRDH